MLLDNRYPDITFKPITQPNSISILGKSLEIAEREGIDAARVKNMPAGIQAINLTSQVTFNTLVDLLDIDAVVLGHLIDKETIKPLNLVKTHHHAFFDINKIAELLTIKFTLIDDVRGLTLLKALQNSQLPKYFGTSFSIIIEGILKQEINLYKNNESSPLIESFVYLDEVIRYLHDHLFRGQETLSVSKLAKVLNVSTAHITDLERRDLILTNHWQSPTRPGDVEVDACSLHAFMTSAISINRVCYFLKLRITAVLPALSDWDLQLVAGSGKPLYMAIVSGNDRTALLNRLANLSKKRLGYDGYRLKKE